MRWIFVFLIGLALAIAPSMLQAPLQSLASSCDSAYPTVCIPSPPPDLNCKDIPFKNFSVLQPDPHRFDGDKNGIGCESHY